MRGWHVLAVLALAIALPAGAAQQPAAAGRGAERAPVAARPGIAIGKLAWVAGQVLRAMPPNKQAWRPVAAGEDVRTGDTLRTAADGAVTIAFPWMDVSLAPSSMLSIPPTTVLSTVLDQGRAEFVGAGRDIVKVVAGDAEVRGGGRLVVRRTSAQTAASAFRGSFRVRGAGRIVEIRAGQGTVVRAGAAPGAAVALAPGPDGLQPGAEVAYVRLGRPLELRWKAAAAAGYHVEVLSVQGERVLLARDTSEPSARVELPWLGTYRWRVSARAADGLESRPSDEGMVAIVQR